MNIDKDTNTELDRSEPSNRLIDIKRIVFQALRYWYVVVLSLSVALTIAFYKNRYTLRIYPVTASIIIKEKEESSGAELLYKNAIIDQYRNYLNEPYIIRSYPLIQRVVEELSFTTCLYREGYILTTEAYKVLPITIKIVDPPINPGTYTFKILSEVAYSLEVLESGKPHQYAFGNFADEGSNKILIDKINDRSVMEFVGVSYLLEIKSPMQAAGEYVGKLNVEWSEEGAGVIDLTINGSNPTKEIDFITGLIRNYQGFDLEKKTQTAERTVNFIKGQLTNITDSLKLFEGQLQQFKKNNKTSGDLGIEAQRMYSKIEGLETQKAELLIKDNYYEYLKKYITESHNLEQVIVPSSMGITDGVITNLVMQIVELQLELKLYIEREKIVNPIFTNRMNKLKELKREVIESTESLKATDNIKLDFLDKQIAVVEKQISLLPLAERQLISIQRNYSLLENLYVFLMQKMSEAEISKASSISDISIVNPPMLSGGSITPKTGQNYAIATVLGLGVPFLIFVLVELVNTRIQSKEDIDKITSIPFIGGIGHKKSLNNLEVLNSPKSSIAESFRALRSNLNYFIDQKDKAVFMVTSSISGEGKTFTTLNLASIFSLSGKKTLIIGADMRKPKIFQDFKLNNEKGLSTYLSGLDSFESVIQKTSSELLDVVSGGPVPPNPSELLLNTRIGQFMKEAKEKYHYIIIDTPPMAIVTDAFVLSSYADHILFLVRQNYTPKTLVRTIHDYYATGKIKNISIVLNDIYKSGPGYGYGGYGYDYYTYGYGYGYGKSKKDGYGYYTE